MKKSVLDPYKREERQSKTMVFTGIPVFLDPPNWQQDQRGVLAGGGVSATIRGGDGGSWVADNQQAVSMLQSPPTDLVPTTMAAVSATRPTLMVDRSRQAKVQPPDTALKCPRCESTNTKFCYYNNYSLTQPRHFCKTCRRYWTKGGALRNVPVGGGYKRNKNSSSANRAQAIETSSATSSGGATMNISSSNCTGELVGLDNQHHLPVIPFLPNIHGFSDYGGGGPVPTTGYLAFSGREFVSSGGVMTSVGLDFPAANEHTDSNVHGQWRMQHQLPPFSHQLLLPYDGGQGLVEHQYLATAVAQLKTRPPIDLSGSDNTIKLEDHQSQNQLANYNFSGNGWGDLSNFPSTTSSLL